MIIVNRWNGRLFAYVMLILDHLWRRRSVVRWDGALEYACDGGHLDLVDLMIERGAADWNRGMQRRSSRPGDADD